MRATLLGHNPDLTATLRTLCALAHVSLATVNSEEQLHVATLQSSDGDLVILDCSAAWSVDVDLCARIAGSCSLPVLIIHPRQDFILGLAPVARSQLLWLEPDFRVLTLLEQLRLLNATAGVKEIPSEQEPLTAREQEIFQLLARGHSNQQIGIALTLARSTVQSHVATIKQKLRAGTRAELIAKYARTSSGRDLAS